MGDQFDKNVFHGYLIKGDLNGAICYLERFPDQEKLHQKYLSVFAREQYPTLSSDSELNALLLIYQKYYRDVFYLGIDAKKAEEDMRDRFLDFSGIDGGNILFGELEEKCVAKAFRKKGFQFLGGKTGGYFGPYIWKTTELKSYDVQLPEARRIYSVRLLDGFISKSWYDHISFGEISTGGWTDGDGIINCIRASYDQEGESFTVSLLKHEAQHAEDLAQHPQMPSEMLEYRAKLVELIYSEKRNLLEQFIQEADSAQKDNGHSLAAARIVEGFGKRLHKGPEELIRTPIQTVQTVAGELFAQSSRELV